MANNENVDRVVIRRHELVDAIMPMLRADVPVCIVGDSGIGKTQGIRQEIIPAWEAECGMPVKFHDIRISSMADEDAGGLPIVEDVNGEKVMRKTRPEMMNPIDDGESMYVMAYEEITHKRNVHHTLYRIFMEREDCTGRPLPKHHRLLATANPREAMGGDVSMFKPLERRMAWVYVECTCDDTVRYGKLRNWDKRLLAFLSAYPEFHSKMSMENPSWPNPERWEKVDTIIKRGGVAPQDLVRQFGMLVGMQAASVFGEVMKREVEIPTVQDILANPNTAPVPSDHSLQIHTGRLLMDYIAKLDRKKAQGMQIAATAKISAYLSRWNAETAAVVVGYYPHKSADDGAWQVLKQFQQ